MSRNIDNTRKGYKAFAEGEGLDWAHAESLAYASLLVQGTPILVTVDGHPVAVRQALTKSAAPGPTTRALPRCDTSNTTADIRRAPTSANMFVLRSASLRERPEPSRAFTVVLVSGIAWTITNRLAARLTFRRKPGV